MDKQTASVLITDIDNTLFDWVEVWFQSFTAMFRQLVKISGLPEAILIEEIKSIHIKYGTSEYAHLIEEIPSFQKKYPKAEIIEIFGPAKDAFREARARHLKLYSGAREMLDEVKNNGGLVVGYTESMASYSGYRIKALNLDGVLDFLFCPPDIEYSIEVTKNRQERYPDDHFEFEHTELCHTPEDELKPNPQLLLDIISRIDADPSECIYLGDHLMKDVLMAKEAGITDIYAKYGKADEREEYELLRLVTHWTKEVVDMEKKIREEDVIPSHTLEKSPIELLSLFQFENFKKMVPEEKMPLSTLKNQKLNRS